MSERNHSAYPPPDPMPDPARLPLFSAPSESKTRSANGHQVGGVVIDNVDGVGHNGHRAAGRWDVPALHAQPVEQLVDQGDYQPDRSDWQLVRELRLEATTRLAEAINAEALDAGARQQRGRSIIADIIRQRVSGDISAGREPWTPQQRKWLRKALDDALFKLGRLQPLLDRDDVENIIITGHHTVWLDLVDGSLERAPAVADSDEELIEFLRWVANRFRPQDNERPFNESVPKLHLSLAWTDDNGEPMRARLAATAFVTVYPVVVVRRHRLTRITLEDLVAKGMLTAVMANFLRACVRAGKSIVVSGPQGAGKTTLIRALCACIDPFEKIGTFETEYELFLHEMPDRHLVVVPWEARPGSTEVDAFGRRAGEFTLNEAIDDSFRFTLSRQIVGEVRGQEIWAMIKAMESGAGSISSTHGRNARQTMDKLVTCAMEAGQTSELATLKLAQTVDVVVQIGLLTQPDGENHWSRTRWVSEVALVEPGDAGYNLDHIFESGFGNTVATPSGTPIKKGLLNELQAHGFNLSSFQHAMGARAGQPS